MIYIACLTTFAHIRIVIKLDLFIIFLYYKGEHISILCQSANSCSWIQYLGIWFDFEVGFFLLDKIHFLFRTTCSNIRQVLIHIRTHRSTITISRHGIWYCAGNFSKAVFYLHTDNTLQLKGNHLYYNSCHCIFMYVLSTWSYEETYLPPQVFIYYIRIFLTLLYVNCKINSLFI